MYYIIGGIKRCTAGGVIGLSLASAFSLLTSREKIKENLKSILNF